VDVTALQHKAICSVLAKLWNANGVKEIIKTANVRNQDTYLNAQKILTLWADVDVTSSIYGNRSYNLTLQRGPVHGAIAGRRQEPASGVPIATRLLYSLLTTYSSPQTFISQ